MANKIKSLIILNTNIKYNVGNSISDYYNANVELPIIKEIVYDQSTKMYIGYSDAPRQRTFLIDDYTLFTIDATMVPVIVIYDLAYKNLLEDK